MKYRAEIDGLRAIAVLPVILFHAGYSVFSGGYVGVDVFFVISGFLITSILIKEISAGDFSLVNFYERRARRILPALYLVLFASAVGAYFVLLPHQLVDFGKSLMSIPVFLSNLYFWSERGYFDASVDLKPLLHTWSLAVEEQFYVVFPLFMMALWRFPKLFLVLLMGAFTLSLFLSWYLTALHFETAFFLPFARAWELAMGSFVALAIYYNKTSKNEKLNECGAACGLAMILWAIFMFDKNTSFPSLNAAIPVFGTALFIWATSSTKGMIAKIVSIKPLVWIGLISYSAYLWHQPLFALSRHIELFEPYKIIWIIASLVLAVFSYAVIEQPFRKKDKIPTATIWRLSVSLGLILMAIGWAFVKNDGFIKKYSATDQAIIQQYDSFGPYNHKRFDALRGADFEENEKLKILLIGDSYARDFINLVYEAGYDQNFTFSAHHQRADCGIVFGVNERSFEDYIPENKRKTCQKIGRFEGKAIQEKIALADELWLVSHWRHWVVGLLPETVTHLESQFGVRVRVFGLKDFGHINPNILLKIPSQDRGDYVQPAKPEAFAMDEKMRLVLEHFNYVSLLEPLCGSDAQSCKIFTSKGTLVSTDGGHITQDSAKQLASELIPVFEDIINIQ